MYSLGVGHPGHRAGQKRVENRFEEKENNQLRTYNNRREAGGSRTMAAVLKREIGAPREQNSKEKVDREMARKLNGTASFADMFEHLDFSYIINISLISINKNKNKDN